MTNGGHHDMHEKPVHAEFYLKPHCGPVHQISDARNHRKQLPSTKKQLCEISGSTCCTEFVECTKHVKQGSHCLGN